MHVYTVLWGERECLPVFLFGCLITFLWILDSYRIVNDPPPPPSLGIGAGVNEKGIEILAVV